MRFKTDQGKAADSLRLALFLLIGWMALAALAEGQLRAQVSEPTVPLNRPAFPPQRTLDSDFSFHPSQDANEWASRRQRIQRNLQVALGLSPLPTRYPLQAVRHGRFDGGDHYLEKVYFESWPGFFVTGNLYLPKLESGSRAPGVLCPHGHWENGRFLWASDATVEREIASGAESFESNARSVLQSRCIHLARMGCVVFHYDMLGYADSQQIPYEVAHGFAQPRPEMEGENWGLFSPQAELELISVMGLQTWNSMRALDFLESLPEVDAQRLAITGASGGGTQTFILCALDDRPQVAFPAVMVSTAMQGGCTCENCCGLRIDVGNVDFAAVFAPKPLGLTAANDWTREMATKGYPELVRIYELFNRPEHVELTSRLEFGHNYNQISREAMYAWFHRHLQLPGEPIRESPIEVRRPEELTVFNAVHPAPNARDTEFESRLLRELAGDAQRQLGLDAAATPVDFSRSAQVVLDGWRSIVNNPAIHTKFWIDRQLTLGDWTIDVGRLEYSDTCRPLALVFGKRRSSRGRPAALMITRWGAPALGDDGSQLPDELTPCIESCDAFCLIDVAFQGSLADSENPSGDNRLVPNGRRAGGYTYGYNRPVFAWRVFQICSALDWLEKQNVADAGPLVLIAPDMFGPEALVSAVVTNTSLGGLAVHLGDFRFDDIRSLTDSKFLPGSMRYGGVPAIIGLLALRDIRISLSIAEPVTSDALLRLVSSDARNRIDLQSVGNDRLTETQIRNWLRGE